MADIAIADDVKPKEPFWKKLVGKESIPTAYAAISALLWFGGFMTVSALASAIYHYFDNWFGWLAQVFVVIAKTFNWHVYTSSVKIILMYSGILGFGIVGTIGFMKKNVNAFKSEREVYITFSSIAAMITAFLVKLSDVDSQVEYRNSSMAFTFVVSATSMMLALIPTSILYFVMRKCKMSQKKSYIIAVLCLSISSAMIFSSADEKSDAFLIFLYMAMPLLLLALNPRRLRQIALFGLLFVGLAASSVILEKAFPAIMPHFDDGKPSPSRTEQLPATL